MKHRKPGEFSDMKSRLVEAQKESESFERDWERACQKLHDTKAELVEMTARAERAEAALVNERTRIDQLDQLQQDCCLQWCKRAETAEAKLAEWQSLGSVGLYEKASWAAMEEAGGPLKNCTLEEWVRRGTSFAPDPEVGL